LASVQSEIEFIIEINLVQIEHSLKKQEGGKAGGKRKDRRRGRETEMVGEAFIWVLSQLELVFISSY
jgi:hypothetical protein